MEECLGPGDGPIDDPRFPCLLSSPLGDGERILLVPLPQGRDLANMILACVRLSDFHGIQECQTSWKQSAGYAELMATARACRPQGPLPISLDEARRVLAETAVLNPGKGTPMPVFAQRLMNWFRLTPAPAPDLPRPTIEDALLAAQSQLLHLELEVQPWTINSLLREAMELDMTDILNSQDPPTPEGREQYCREVALMMAERSIAPEGRRQMGRMLWNLADFFERSGRLEQAKLARAEAQLQYHNVPEGPTGFEYGLFLRVLLRLQMKLRGDPPPRSDQLLPGLAELLSPRPPPETVS